MSSPRSIAESRAWPQRARKTDARPGRQAPCLPRARCAPLGKTAGAQARCGPSTCELGQPEPEERRLGAAQRTVDLAVSWAPTSMLREGFQGERLTLPLP